MCQPLKSSVLPFTVYVHDTTTFFVQVVSILGNCVVCQDVFVNSREIYRLSLWSLFAIPKVQITTTLLVQLCGEQIANFWTV